MLLLAKTLDPLNFPFFLLLSALVLLTCKTKFMFFFCLVNWHARCHETLFFEAVACWQVWSSFTLWSILITDIKGALTLDVLVEYLALCDLLSEVSLQLNEEDTHVWQFSASGQYTSKSAYEALFIGATSFGPWERIWKSWAPSKCKFFLWTVALNRCWIADRLARKGLPHPGACPLCDQVEETIDHLLVACIFSWQVWFRFLQHFNLQILAT